MKLTDENIKKLRPDMRNFASKYAPIFERIVTMILPDDKSYDYTLRGDVGGSYTNHRKIVVSFNTDFFVPTKRGYVFDRNRAYIAAEMVSMHECGHILYTNSKHFVNYQQIIGDILIAEGIDEDLARKTAGEFLNINEDGRIEKRVCKRLPGVKKYFKYIRGQQLINPGFEEMLNPEGIDPTSVDVNLIIEWFIFRNMVLSLATAGFFPQGYTKEIAPRFPVVHDELVKANEHIVDAVNGLTGRNCCEAVLKLFQDSKDFIVERLKEIQKNSQNKQQVISIMSDFDFDGEADAETEDAEVQGQSKGKSSKQGGKHSGKPIPKEYEPGEYNEGVHTDDFSEEAPENAKLDIKDILDKMEEELNKQAEESMNAEDKKDGSSPKKDEADQDLSELDVYKDQYTRHLKVIPRTCTLQPLPGEYGIEATILKKEVDKFFQNRSVKDRRHRKSGTICGKDLYRIKSGNHDVFIKKGLPNQTEAVVSICWDGSGSMYGDKQALSAKACAIIEEGFKEHVPMKIINFSVSGGNVVHYLVKDFDEKAKNKNYSFSYADSRGFGGGNKDGYSIRVCTRDLLSRPEKDKILFVLSDGQPSDYNGKLSGEDDVKAAVKEARAKGITVIAIFFGSDSFLQSSLKDYEYMYQKDLIASRPEDITTNLKKMLKKLVLR